MTQKDNPPNYWVTQAAGVLRIGYKATRGNSTRRKVKKIAFRRAPRWPIYQKMRSILYFLKMLADLLLQVAGRAMERLRASGRKTSRCVQQAIGWVVGAISGGCERLWKLDLRACVQWVRVREEQRALQAALVRFEQLVGWRLGGAQMSESHVLAA